MYSDKDLIRVLKRDLNSEFKAIRFYLDNLEKLNYKKNRENVNKLALESVKHSRMIVETILSIQEKKSGKLDKKAVKDALREEVGMEGIYKYEFLRTKNVKVLKLLNMLIKEEKKHMKIVNSLK